MSVLGVTSPENEACLFSLVTTENAKVSPDTGFTQRDIQKRSSDVEGIKLLLRI
jgi:hypothetical protein